MPESREGRGEVERKQCISHMTRASIWLYRRIGTSTEQQDTQLHSEYTQGKLTGVEPHFIPPTVTDMPTERKY